MPILRETYMAVTLQNVITMHRYRGKALITMLRAARVKPTMGDISDRIGPEMIKAKNDLMNTHTDLISECSDILH